MGLCEVRAAFRHAVPEGFFNHWETSGVNEACERPARVRVGVRGLERGNHRDGATVHAFGFCETHLHAFQELDHRLRAGGWSSAIAGPPVPVS